MFFILILLQIFSFSVSHAKDPWFHLLKPMEFIGSSIHPISLPVQTMHTDGSLSELRIDPESLLSIALFSKSWPQTVEVVLHHQVEGQAEPKYTRGNTLFTPEIAQNIILSFFNFVLRENGIDHPSTKTYLFKLFPNALHRVTTLKKSFEEIRNDTALQNIPSSKFILDDLLDHSGSFLSVIESLAILNELYLHLGNTQNQNLADGNRFPSLKIISDKEEVFQFEVIFKLVVSITDRFPHTLLEFLSEIINSDILEVEHKRALMIRLFNPIADALAGTTTIPSLFNTAAARRVRVNEKSALFSLGSANALWASIGRFGLGYAAIFTALMGFGAPPAEAALMAPVFIFLYRYFSWVSNALKSGQHPFTQIIEYIESHDLSGTHHGKQVNPAKVLSLFSNLPPHPSPEIICQTLLQ